MRKRFFGIVLAFVMVFSLASCQSGKVELPENNIVVLFTNDVHCNVDENMGYAGLVQLKNQLTDKGNEVILADVGDAVQGKPIGTISKGEYIIDIMNYVGYDVAALGNHEFDYGVERLMEIAKRAEFPYVSANFKEVEADKAVFEPYVIIEKAGVEIAFVGVVTPWTLSTTVPTYFQNENKEYIYTFCHDNEGQELYDTVQKSVDKARGEGADYVIVLSHLGLEEECIPWRSTDLIQNTTGIDVILDAHSHDTVFSEEIENKKGEKVLMSQTGTGLVNIGQLTIDTEGNISVTLVEGVDGKDNDTIAFIDDIKSQFANEVNKVVATSDVDLIMKDGEIRIVRLQETNLGDLCADGYRMVSGSDVAIVNGGGIRTNIEKGDVTYENILNVHPYGNELCVVEATGQEILDALEMSAMYYPAENGGFLQVSGMTYEINSKIESTVKLNEDGSFQSVEGVRRVENVRINNEPCDVNKVYTVASHNFLLKSGGDGYSMFMDNKLLQDGVMLDNQVLITYITEHLNGKVGEEYSNLKGEGRILIK